MQGKVFPMEEESAEGMQGYLVGYTTPSLSSAAGVMRLLTFNTPVWFQPTPA